MSCDEKNEPMQILSLGAGVQSSTLALMAAHGEIGPMPDCAIFADVQAEPKAVYDYLEWLKGVLPFPVHIISNGSLDSLSTILHTSKSGNKRTNHSPPAFLFDEFGLPSGMAMRQCTTNFKILPIVKKLRELAGIKRGEKAVKVVQWIGISLDEISRMKPAREPWIENVWPLVDKGLNRHDCLQWLKRNGYPQPARSACYFCPYHSDREWREQKENDPDSFSKSIEYEKRLRNAVKGGKGFKGDLFLHRSGVPLDQVDLTTEADHGQLDMFQNECEGMCGV